MVAQPILAALFRQLIRHIHNQVRTEEPFRAHQLLRGGISGLRVPAHISAVAGGRCGSAG
jgi:hypothetical protein